MCLGGIDPEQLPIDIKSIYTIFKPLKLHSFKEAALNLSSDQSMLIS